MSFQAKALRTHVELEQLALNAVLSSWFNRGGYVVKTPFPPISRGKKMAAAAPTNPQPTMPTFILPVSCRDI